MGQAMHAVPSRPHNDVQSPAAARACRLTPRPSYLLSLPPHPPGRIAALGCGWSDVKRPRRGSVAEHLGAP